MAKRGMLPKFRPAQLGRDAPVRPTIRPVKPSAPPPPPAPPRRHTSGFGARGAFQLHVVDAEREQPTHTGAAGSLEPSTLERLERGPGVDAGPATTLRRDVLAAIAIDPEDGAATASAPRARPEETRTLSFEDETEARPVDNGLLDRMRYEQAVQPAAPLDVPYDSLPSLEVRRPYDTYEAEFSERDPVTQLHGAMRDSNRLPRAERHEPSYREPSYEDPASYAEPTVERPPGHLYSDPPLSNDEPVFPLANAYPSTTDEDGHDPETFARREGSGARPSPRYAAPVPSFDEGGSAPWNPAYSSAPGNPKFSTEPYAPTGFSTRPPPANDAYVAPVEPLIPPAPRVPQDVHAPVPFVMGVQALRTPTPPGPWAAGPRAMTPMPGPLPSPMQAIQSSMPQAHQAHQAHYQPHYPQTSPPPAYGTVAASPRFATPTPRPHVSHTPHQGSPAPAAHQQMMMQRAQPVGQQLEAAPAPRISRFAWFVAGAAFGITFAFFATGFFGARMGREDATFPAPAPLPTQSAQVVAQGPANPTQAAAPAAQPATPAAAPQPVSQTSAFAPPPEMPTLPAAPTPVAAAPKTVQPSGARPSAPAPRARFTPPRAPATRRTSASSSPAPRSIGGGGEGAPEPAPAPAPPTIAVPDVGDLLGNALKP